MASDCDRQRHTTTTIRGNYEEATEGNAVVSGER